MPSPWPASVVPQRPLACGSLVWRMHGALRVTVVVKAAFALVHEQEARLLAPTDLVTADRSTPGSNGVDEISDLAPYLPSAGVVVSGHACAPPGVAASSTAVRLILSRPEGASLDKTLHIFGDRDASPAARPLPFVRMPLIWERTRAYGGPGIDDNPVGVGAQPGSRAFPNIVDAVDPRRPAGFGPIGARWPARARLLAGAEPPALDRPVVEIPDGFDWRWFHAAPADQQVGFLQGDEWIALDGMSPSQHRLLSRLPQIRAEARWFRETPAGRSEARPLELGADTLAIDADRKLCWLVWRGHFPIESLADLPALRVQVSAAQPGQPVVWPEAAPPPVAPIAVAVAITHAAPDPMLGGGDRTVRLNMREIAEHALRPIAPFALAAPGSRTHAATPGIPGAPSSWLTPKVTQEARGPIGIGVDIESASASASEAEGDDADTAKMKAKRPAEPRLGGLEDDPHDRTTGLRLQDMLRPIAPFALAAPGAREGASPASAAASPAIPGAPWGAPAPPVPSRSPFDLDDAPTFVPAAPPPPPALVPAAAPPALVPAAAPPPALVPAAAPQPGLVPAAPQPGLVPAAPQPGLVPAAPPPPLVQARASLPSIRDESTDTETDEPQDSMARTTKMRAKVQSKDAPFALTPPGVRSAPSTPGLAIPGAPFRSPAATSFDDEVSADREHLTIDPDLDSITESSLREAPVPEASNGALDTLGLNDLRRKVVARLASGEPFDDQDLSRADLHGLDFQGRSLVRCNLRGAKLRGCVFDGARLEGAQLGEADLTEASLVGADLARADLSRATLTRACFDRAKLADAKLAFAEGQGASFRGATGQRTSFARGGWSAAVLDEMAIAGADFTGARLDGASFRAAVAAEIRLADAAGSDVVFDDARLPDARGRGASLPRASFKDADVQRSAWGKARLDGAAFDGANLRGASFAEASCASASFRAADLSEATLQEADVTGARFADANLRGARLTRLRGAGAVFTGASLDGADLRHASLPGASFAGAALRRARADHAALEGASFALADLTEISLRSAGLRRANLAQSILRGADLRDADLEGANLFQASREGAKMAGANTRDLRDEPEPNS